MSEPRTFELAWEAYDPDGTSSESDKELAHNFWRDSRTALLADRPIPEGLIEALGRQTRIDEDGTLCGVCRQAVDEARELLESQAAQLAASQEEVKRLREALEWVKSDIEICDWHCERCGKDYEMKKTDMAAVVRAALDKEPTR